jgi:sporulation-control protein spo0M
MKTYYFPDQDVTITPTEIIKNGFAGGSFANDESQGSFTVDIILKSESTNFGYTLYSPDTMPLDFSVEEIQLWVETQLDLQFLITE